MKVREQLGDREGTRPRPLRSDARIADDELAYAARLLREIGPLARSEHRRRRVWHKLQSMPALRPWPARRTVYVAAASAFFAAASSAAIGRYWERSADLPGEAANAAARAPSLPSVSAVVAPVPALASVPQAFLPAEAHPTTQASPRAGKARPSSVGPTPVEAEPEAALLLRAMRARREGNPTQVEALAAEYRQRHPHGALGEEALMLSIEAAQSRGDPKARVLAREYLSRFPAGRFRSQAERAVATPSR